KFPALERAMTAFMEALELHFLTNIKPEFKEMNTFRYDHTLKVGRLGKEGLKLRTRAKSHHPFDPGPVIPGPIEGYEFTKRRKMPRIALKIPLSPLSFRGLG